MFKKYITLIIWVLETKKLLAGCCLIKYQTFSLHMQPENRTTASHLGGKSVQWVEAAGRVHQKDRVAIVREVRCETVKNY